MNRPGASILAAILVAGCFGGSSTPPATPLVSQLPSPPPTATPETTPTAHPADTIELARSELARAAVDPATAAVAAGAINTFGFELYARVAAQSGNLVMSPASIAIALSMARAGARGTTAAEMDAALYELGSDELAGAINALDAALASRNGVFKDSAGDEQDVTLNIANALFAQRDMALQAAYLDAMAGRYGAGVWQVDYAADPEAARLAINAWVADQTEDRIPEILVPGQVTEATRLALANAIYLKAPWLNPFAENLTAPGLFTRIDGTTATVPMMRLGSDLAYGAGVGWRAVELPYVGSGLAMTVIVPDDLPTFEAAMTSGTLADIVGSLAVMAVDLAMPAFDTESRAELKPLLMALGMSAAFDPAAADFSGITNEEDLFIGFVIHQANITVDEAGTEAAAATVVGMDTTGGGPPPVELRVDRPFLFVLRDVPTGAVVFLGRVADPGETR